MDTAGSPLAVNETDRLIASDKVEGTSVYDRNASHIGSIYNVMIDKYSGQVGYAVISFGGFLGIGTKYYPIPWKKLSYDRALGGYVVDLTHEQLERAPAYAADASPWGDPSYGRGVYDYYDVPYYM
jgi:sporulation protein YlmC with PRC-barrel domain